MVILNRATLSYQNNVPVLRRTHEHSHREEQFAETSSKRTHMHLEKQGITAIGELSPYPRLRVLYLFDNKIHEIQNLDFCSYLTHLYLQNNCITRITNMHCLPHLHKLYLSGNRIAMLEGLERNGKLNEIHIDHQCLPDGESLVVDPRTALALKHCLLTLDISGNNLFDLGSFEDLDSLTGLFASDNRLTNMNVLLSALEKFPNLRFLKLSGNPIAKTMRYREKVIMAAYRLEELDGKTVSPQNKQFLTNMLHSRHPFPACEVPSGQSLSDTNVPIGLEQLLLPNVSGTRMTNHMKTTADTDGQFRCVLPVRSRAKLRTIPSAMMAQQEQILRKVYHKNSLQDQKAMDSLWDKGDML